MTAETDLLPLPEPFAVKYPDSGLRDDEHALRLWAAHGYDTGGEPLFSAEQLREATATLQAEIEALRAEVEMLRDAFSDEDMTAGAHWFGRYVEQKRRAEQLAEEVDVLRAEVREAREFSDKMANAIGSDQLRRFIEKHGEPVPLTIRMQQAEARSELLVEALEEIRSRCTMNLAMHPDPSALTARLGDIYQIADAVLSKENSND